MFISVAFSPRVLAFHVPARQRTDPAARIDVNRHVYPRIPSRTVLNNPAHRTDYHYGLSQIISSFIAPVSQTTNAHHGADPLPPRHRQEDRQGAFQQAVEQERGYTGTLMR